MFCLTSNDQKGFRRLGLKLYETLWYRRRQGYAAHMDNYVLLLGKNFLCTFNVKFGGTKEIY